MDRNRLFFYRVSEVALPSPMSVRPAGFHEYFPCSECGYGCSTAEDYENHLITGHQYSKRKAKTTVNVSKWRHSMCRDCWNDKHKNVSSVGHEVPQRFRKWEMCCFCGKRHKDGINSRTNPESRD